MFDADLKASHVAGFFKDVVFSATGELEEKVSEALSLGGAKKMNYLTGNSTHCIVGNNPEQSDIIEATEMLDVPAVNQNWVLASLFCKQLLPLKAFSPTAKKIMRGVLVCVDASILSPDVDILWAITNFHGAKLTKVWSSEVTHLLATRPGSQLYTRMLASKECKIVTPDWLSDWAREGIRPDEVTYHPRLLNIPENLPKPIFHSTLPTAPSLKTEVDKVTAQTGKLGVSPVRLPGPPQIGQPRLPGPPPLTTTPRPLGAAVATPRLAALAAQSSVRTPTPASVPSTSNNLSNVSTSSITAKPNVPTPAAVANTTTTTSAVPQRPLTTTTTATTTTTQTTAPKAIATIIQSTMPMAGLNINPVSNVAQVNSNADKSAPSTTTSTTTVGATTVSQASTILTPASGAASSKPPTTLAATTPQLVINPTTNSQPQPKEQAMTTVNTASMPNKPIITTPSNNTTVTTTNSNMSQLSSVQTSQAGVPPQPLNVQTNPTDTSGPATGKMTLGGPNQSQRQPGQSVQTSQPSSMLPQQQNKPPHGQLQQVTGQTVTLAQQPFNTMQQQTIQRFPNQAAMAGGRGTPPTTTTSGLSTGPGIPGSSMPPGSQQQPVSTSGMSVSTAGGPPGQQTMPGSMTMSTSGPTPTTGVGSMQTTTANNPMNPSQQQSSNMMQQQGMMVRPQGLPPGAQMISGPGGQMVRIQNGQQVTLQQPGQPGQPRMPGQQPGMPGQQSGMPGQQPGQPGMPGQQPGQPSMPGQTGMPGQQLGIPGQQPSQPGQQPSQPGQPGMPGQQSGIPGQQPGMPGQQPGMPGQQPGQSGMPGQQMRMQGPQQQMGIRAPQGHPAILQQHEQIRMQQQQQQQQGQQQPGGGQMMQKQMIGPPGQQQPGGMMMQVQGQPGMMQQQGQPQQQWSGQQQPGQPGIMQQQPGQPGIMQQQQWNPQNQQQMMPQGMARRMIGPPGGVVGRPMTPHMQRQQQVIQQHIQQLTPEQRQQFNNMDPRQKQQYLAQKGLIIPNPTGQWGQTVQLQRHTIQLTEQQKQMLQNMNPQDRSLFIQKLSKEREVQLRAQMQIQQQNMMAQQQQQQNIMASQQQNMMSPQGMMPGPQGQGMVQQQGQQQAVSVGSPVTSQWQQGSPVPSSPQHQPVSPMQQHPNMSPGSISPATGPTGQRMASPVGPPVGSVAGGPTTQIRPPQWSGETHPALAQVPRTPQQIQHLQRLQMQRQQIGSVQDPSGQPQSIADCSGSMVGPQQSMSSQQSMAQMGKAVVVSSGGGMEMISSVPQTVAGMPQHVMLGPNGQNQTKQALQNMLSNRLGPGGQPLPPGAPGPPPVVSSIPGGVGVSGDTMVVQAQGVPPGARMQIMTQGVPTGMPPQSQQQHMMAQQQQQMLAMQQRNNALRNVTNVTAAAPQHAAMMGGKPAGMAGMAGAAVGPRFGPRTVGPTTMVGMRPTPQVPGGIPQARLPQFIGHHIETRLPPDLCLLGCIFVVTDYQDSEEYAKFVASWKKTITQYGGEIETSLSPRVTHLLCSSQKSALAQQARVEGKRLVTCFWLNDTIRKKKVMPPWKAIHFPLPAQFEPPCTNMILCLTGFQDRDRDLVKEMIRIVGAKCTRYFSKHNHAIICKAPVGEKYDKAREWKVPVVSVQWLNDVMFGSVNAAQCMSNAKYQGFKNDDPLRIDYSLVPHLISAWKLPGIRVTPETYQKFKANPPARIKRKADKQRLENETKEKRRRLNEERAAQGLPPLEPGCFTQLEGETDLDPATGLPVPRPQPPPPPPIQNKEKGDTIKKEAEEEKENNPFKVPGVETIKIMFTNTPSNIKMELNDLLTDMCTEYTTNPSEVTHLIMSSLGRTNNFLQALPTVKYILTPDWIRKSKAAGKWLPEQDFIVKDEKFEEAFGCNIAKLLRNPERNKIFHGKVFYITPSVEPSLKVIKSLVESAGGRVENRRLKTTNQIRELNKGGVVNYIIITCAEDLHLVTEILRSKQHIYTSEFVLSAVLQCEMDFDISRYMTTVNHNENEHSPY